MPRLMTYSTPTVAGVRSSVLLHLVLVLVFAGLVVATPGGVQAQGAADSEVDDLGILGNEDGSELRVEGRWTIEGCDSVFPGAGKPGGGTVRCSPHADLGER